MTPPTGPALQIRALQPAHLGEVARIHRDAFPRSALSRLGRASVYRYYLWQLQGPHEICALGAWLDGALVGFVVAGVFRGALGGFLSRNRGLLTWAVLVRPWILGHHQIRQAVAVALRSLARRSSRRPPDRSPQGDPPARRESFGVLSIAVARSARRYGVARELMHHVEREAERRGFRRLHLTVRERNQGAIRFYEALGWAVTERQGDAVRMAKRLGGADETTRAAP